MDGITEKHTELIKERNRLRTHLMEFAQWAADENNVLIGAYRDILCVCCREAGYLDEDARREIYHKPDCLHLWAKAWVNGGEG